MQGQGQEAKGELHLQEEPGLTVVSGQAAQTGFQRKTAEPSELGGGASLGTQGINLLHAMTQAS